VARGTGAHADGRHPILRELARQAGAEVHVLPADARLRLGGEPLSR